MIIYNFLMQIYLEQLYGICRNDEKFVVQESEILVKVYYNDY